MNKDKAITLTISAVVVILAIAVAIGGNFLINKYQDKIKEFDKKEKTTTTTTTTTKTTTTKTSKSSKAPQEFQTYMKNTQVKIKSNWQPPADEKSGQVIMSYKINRNGELESFKILKSSGSQKLDESAVNSLKKSSPFEPLPKDFKGDDIDVQFTFDYNVKKSD